LADRSSAPACIGLDGFNMAMPRGTGVATYGRELSRTLGSMGHGVDVLFGMAIGARTPELLREILFFDSLDQEKSPPAPMPMSSRWLREVVSGPLGLVATEVPITGRVVADALAARMPHHDRVLNAPNLFDVANRYFRRTKRFLRVRVSNPPQVMHWTYPLPILLEGTRNIYTMHDLVPLRLPYSTLDNKRAYLRLIRGCLRWGDHVCTVSEASRRDILSLFPVQPDRVTNTYQTAGLPEEVRPDEDIAGWLNRLFGLRHKEYFLFYGALEPKKNIGRMIQAYLASGVETPLVIVGGRSWKAESELRLIVGHDGKPTQVSARIHILEYMPSAWLGTLVRGARAVLFASLYEGFGLPVLEAMQLGTPVLTSTTSSLPEVAGNAALLVDPYDPGAIAEGLRALDRDPVLRAQLSEAGLQQASHFSLQRYAERLTTLYQAVLAGPSATPMAVFDRNH
jgi:glycosyltransferase involved in cell wall biosynthesis